MEKKKKTWIIFLVIGILLAVMILCCGGGIITALIASGIKNINSSGSSVEESDASTLISDIFENSIIGEDKNDDSDQSSIVELIEYHKIGVSMPTKDLQRWNQDGANIKMLLEQEGYDVDLQYASNDINTQVTQIENMISSGCNVLVIASIDGNSLGTVLEQAKQKNIPVIAYDRLIMNSDAVTYYATFDNYMVGTKQGQYIEERLGLKEGKGPYNLEIFTGDPGDNNARFFYAGAMDVLNPYINNGQLVVPSGQIDFDTVATANWASDAAQARMEAIISSNYANGKKLDAVLCSNDSTAFGVTNALVANNIYPYPIITGQDCDIANVKNMIQGKQSMSIFKDTRTLAQKTVEMVDAILKDGTAPTNDTSTYNNGVKFVPSYLCEPVFADVNNYRELLIDSGYYTADQLQ